MTARAPRLAPHEEQALANIRLVDQSVPQRGDARPRCLSGERTAARNIELPILQRALKDAAISNQALSDALGASGDRVGALIRHGSAPLTLGEAALLIPSLPAVGHCFLELLELRIDREIAASGLQSNDPTLTQLRLAKSHIDALRVLLGGATE